MNPSAKSPCSCWWHSPEIQFSTERTRPEYVVDFFTCCPSLQNKTSATKPPNIYQALREDTWQQTHFHTFGPTQVTGFWHPDHLSENLHIMWKPLPKPLNWLRATFLAETVTRYHQEYCIDCICWLENINFVSLSIRSNGCHSDCSKKIARSENLLLKRADLSSCSDCLPQQVSKKIWFGDLTVNYIWHFHEQPTGWASGFFI